MKLRAAYCSKHRRAMTPRQIKQHGCMDGRKQRHYGRCICKYLKRLDPHVAKKGAK